MKSIRKNVVKNLFLVTLAASTLFIFISPVISFAQITIDPSASDGKIHNPLGTNGPTDISKFIHDVLIGAIKIGIPVIALAIIYSGFLFVFAMGKPEDLNKAKDALLYTLIGAALLLGAWAIANLIVSTVGGLG